MHVSNPIGAYLVCLYGAPLPNTPSQAIGTSMLPDCATVLEGAPGGQVRVLLRDLVAHALYVFTDQWPALTPQAHLELLYKMPFVAPFEEPLKTLKKNVQNSVDRFYSARTQTVLLLLVDDSLRLFQSTALADEVPDQSAPICTSSHP